MLSINIRRLLAWSPGFILPEESALPSVHFSIQSKEKYSTSLISPAQGRRLSDLTKSSVDLGLRLTQETEVDHVIFSSRHGELANATKLVEMIGRNEVLSPMLFSQSVHNAAIGSYTLFKKIHAATTSLGGGKNGFMMGLVSCAIYLKENPTAQVLYIAADEKVPETFKSSLTEKNLPYAAAFLLSASGAGCQLDFEMTSANPAQPRERNPILQTVEFLNWFFSSAPATEINGELMSWKIKKCLKQ